MRDRLRGGTSYRLSLPNRIGVPGQYQIFTAQTSQSVLEAR